MQIAAAELDLQLLMEKKQYEWNDNSHKRSCMQNYRPGDDVVLCTGYLSPIFSKRSNIFPCVNVGKKFSYVAVTCLCFEALVVVCCLLMKYLAVF